MNMIIGYMYKVFIPKGEIQVIFGECKMDKIVGDF